MGLFTRRGRVQKLQEAGDLEGLGELLADRDLHVTAEGEALDLSGADKQEAAAALAASGDERALSFLQQGLSNPDPRVRAAVIREVSSLSSREARLVLADVATTERDVIDSSGRSFALSALAGGDADVLPDLTRRVVVREDDLVLSAEHESTFRALLDQPGADQQAMADVLIEALRHPDERVRTRAHGVIPLLETDIVLAPLVAALETGETRKEAVRALGRLGSVSAVDPLLPLLQDESPQIRQATATALGEIRHPSAVIPLTGVARDDDYDVRAAAIAALNSFGTIAIMLHLEDQSATALPPVTKSTNGPPALPAEGEKPAESRLARIVRAALEP